MLPRTLELLLKLLPSLPLTKEFLEPRGGEGGGKKVGGWRGGGFIQSKNSE